MKKSRRFPKKPSAKLLINESHGGCFCCCWSKLVVIVTNYFSPVNQSHRRRHCLVKIDWLIDLVALTSFTHYDWLPNFHLFFLRLLRHPPRPSAGTLFSSAFLFLVWQRARIFVHACFLLYIFIYFFWERAKRQSRKLKLLVFLRRKIKIHNHWVIVNSCACAYAVMLMHAYMILSYTQFYMYMYICALPNGRQFHIFYTIMHFKFVWYVGF